MTKIAKNVGRWRLICDLHLSSGMRYYGMAVTILKNANMIQKLWRLSEKL
jgi:hypothetical protein